MGTASTSLSPAPPPPLLPLRSGLDYCHRRGVVNRDIKLENTLLQMVQGLPLPLLKICDFGYSKAHFMSAPKSKVGGARV